MSATAKPYRYLHSVSNVLQSSIRARVRRPYHGNEVVLQGQDEGGAVHAGEQGEGEPQQHPLHLLLPHARSLPMLQTQLRRPRHGHCLHLHSSHICCKSVVSLGTAHQVLVLCLKRRQPFTDGHQMLCLLKQSGNGVQHTWLEPSSCMLCSSSC